jgi:excisionase family DNA binding protein
MEKQRAWSLTLESRGEMNNEKDLSSGFLNVQEIANYLELRKSSIYSLVEKKGIPHYRVGRLVRFKKAEIDEWMKEQKEEVVDVKVDVKKVFRPIEKKRDLDVNRIVKKAIEEVKGKRYTAGNGKPDLIEGLRKEVSNGTL